ncbi:MULTISPECIES: alpha/beta fold hydrolase [Streptomyces]|uniref:Alpha/beta fold hydrolase n=1 Tax=Streptomyces ramulosus TaxID=47762 RepID=A0ABW1FIU7_9ACTN
MTTPIPAAFARTVRGEGPGLLLAHGASGSIEDNYGPILDGLAARHTVVGVDYPGSGATPAADRLEVDTLADQLIAAADAEGLDTFAVSGYSLGGPVAIRLATRYPERVSSLVLTATFGYTDARTELVAAVWQQLLEAGHLTALAAYTQLMALSEPALHALTPAQVRADTEQLAAGLTSGPTAQVNLVRRIDVREELAGLTVPALVVVTTEDRLVSPVLQRELAAAVPTAETVEVLSGHCPFADQPRQWLEVIEDFLARTAGR